MYKEHVIAHRKVQMHTSLLWSVAETYISKTSIPILQRYLRPGFGLIGFFFPI